MRQTSTRIALGVAIAVLVVTGTAVNWQRKPRVNTLTAEVTDPPATLVDVSDCYTPTDNRVFTTVKQLCTCDQIRADNNPDALTFCCSASQVEFAQGLINAFDTRDAQKILSWKKYAEEFKTKLTGTLTEAKLKETMCNFLGPDGTEIQKLCCPEMKCSECKSEIGKVADVGSSSAAAAVSSADSGTPPASTPTTGGDESSTPTTTPPSSAPTHTPPVPPTGTSSLPVSPLPSSAAGAASSAKAAAASSVSETTGAAAVSSTPVASSSAASTQRCCCDTSRKTPTNTFFCSTTNPAAIDQWKTGVGTCEDICNPRCCCNAQVTIMNTDGTKSWQFMNSVLFLNPYKDGKDPRGSTYCEVINCGTVESKSCSECPSPPSTFVNPADSCKAFSSSLSSIAAPSSPAAASSSVPAASSSTPAVSSSAPASSSTASENSNSSSSRNVKFYVLGSVDVKPAYCCVDPGPAGAKVACKEIDEMTCTNLAAGDAKADAVKGKLHPTEEQCKAACVTNCGDNVIQAPEQCDNGESTVKDFDKEPICRAPVRCLEKGPNIPKAVLENYVASYADFDWLWAKALSMNGGKQLCDDETCQFIDKPALCGDGVLDPGEDCDFGAPASKDPQKPPVMGCDTAVPGKKRPMHINCGAKNYGNLPADVTFAVVRKRNIDPGWLPLLDDPNACMDNCVNYKKPAKDPKDPDLPPDKGDGGDNGGNPPGGQNPMPIGGGVPIGGGLPIGGNPNNGNPVDDNPSPTSAGTDLPPPVVTSTASVSSASSLSSARSSSRSSSRSSLRSASSTMSSRSTSSVSSVSLSSFASRSTKSVASSSVSSVRPECAKFCTADNCSYCGAQSGKLCQISDIANPAGFACFVTSRTGWIDCPCGNSSSSAQSNPSSRSSSSSSSSSAASIDPDCAKFCTVDTCSFCGSQSNKECQIMDLANPAGFACFATPRKGWKSCPCSPPAPSSSSVSSPATSTQSVSASSEHFGSSVTSAASTVSTQTSSLSSASVSSHSSTSVSSGNPSSASSTSRSTISSSSVSRSSTATSGSSRSTSVSSQSSRSSVRSSSSLSSSLRSTSSNSFSSQRSTNSSSTSSLRNSSSASRVKICGNGRIDLGEDCDNGGVCAAGDKLGQICFADSDCFVQRGFCQSGRCSDGGLCNNDFDCIDQYDCTYNLARDLTCSNKCLRISSSSRSSSKSGSSLSNSSNSSSSSSSSSTLCGNGTINTGEECDDGTKNSWIANAHCRPDCKLWSATITTTTTTTTARCGNGIVETGEQCDFGSRNGQTGVNCTTSCKTSQAQALCGNRIIESPEQCDLGEDNGKAGTACSGTCTLTSSSQTSQTATVAPYCGNGVVNVNEQCDDGNRTAGDGCSATCTLEGGWNCNGSPSDCCNVSSGICGNGIRECAEQCDDGNTRNGDGCSTQCTIESGSQCKGDRPSRCCMNGGFCGDGILACSGEQCDDGNTVSGDGCSMSCRYESTIVTGTALCGNGRLDAGEECDDKNRRDLDGCSANCYKEQGVCGDGIVQHARGEQCEPTVPLASPFYTCDANCHFALRFCGNGILDAGEECDAGTQNSNKTDSVCRTDCTLPRCGDAIMDGGEECDDGNLLNGDGCDRFCFRESPAPQNPIATIPATCGNGVLDPGEQCDDGNRIAGDGCSIACTVELSPRTPSSAGTTIPVIPGKNLATLTPIATSHAPVGNTGPVTASIMAAGAAFGFAWMRRRHAPKKAHA